MDHLPKSKKIAILLAVMSAMLFASLNQTIVATAMPKIISGLGGMAYYSWVFTIYLLTASISAILVGKLSDIFGRKPFLISGILVFLTGSFLNGLSPTIFHLIIFRGIQGIGGGMIMSLSFSAVGDIFPPRERGRWQGIMMSVFGLSSLLGPTLGGWMVDHAEWHWVFWIFLPFGLVAFFMIWLLFPPKPKRNQESVDFLGSVSITMVIIPILLAFTWAGDKYPWLSPEILGLFVTSGLALFVFVNVEKRARSPVLPVFLFQNSIFCISNLASFILGAAMFGAAMFVPMFVQGVLGISATISGFISMPMTFSMVVTSSIIGQVVTRTGKYKKLALAGLLIMSGGLALLSVMDTKTSGFSAARNMVIVGTGLGMSLPIFTLTIQNSVEHHLLGVVTASTQLFRQMGGTIGVSVMGSIMGARMQPNLTAVLTGQNTALWLGQENGAILDALKDPRILMNHEKLSEMVTSVPLPLQPVLQDLVQKLKVALGLSLDTVFLTGAGLLLGAFLIALLLQEIPLRTTISNNPGEAAVLETENPVSGA